MTADYDHMFAARRAVPETSERNGYVASSVKWLGILATLYDSADAKDSGVSLLKAQHHDWPCDLFVATMAAWRSLKEFVIWRAFESL